MQVSDRLDTELIYLLSRLAKAPTCQVPSGCLLVVVNSVVWSYFRSPCLNSFAVTERERGNIVVGDILVV